MCRIALLINADERLSIRLANLQTNGATRPPTYWRSGGLTLIHSRFDVTTSAFDDTDFPLRDDRYVVHFNGEVFGYSDQAYADQTAYPSDVHYCLALIREHGIEGFLAHADLQGTFQIHDTWSNVSYLVADQINSAGSFYAHYNGTFIAAQEVSLVHWVLEQLGADASVPISRLANGRFLKINHDGAVEAIEYRSYSRQVYGGRDSSPLAVENIVSKLQAALVEATIRRLPQDGPIVVLNGGGVDSSVILAIVVKHLRTLGEIDRLKVVTFGQLNIPGLPDADNDFVNSLSLLKALHLSPKKHLIQVREDRVARQSAFSRHVFCDWPRLVTPNPVLNSQVRHTVRMALVLSELVRKCPYVKVVITGDVADELFAGYHSMRVGVRSGTELANRVRQKLSDLPLNDSARYTLASLYGCSSVLTDSVDNEQGQSEEGPGMDAAFNSLHPVEVRTPFSSHRVLQLLCDAPPDCLVGSFGDRVMSKFLLRIVALRSGVPLDIATRKKIPFNEGGSGIRNSERDPLEEASARAWTRYSETELITLVERDRHTLEQLGLMPIGSTAADAVGGGYEQMATYAAAKLCGLNRLVRGGVFSSRMPDTVYSTDERELAYQPAEMLHYDPHGDKLDVVYGSETEQLYV